MTNETLEQVNLTRKIVQPEKHITLHSLELLMEVATNLLHDTSVKEKITSVIQECINEEYSDCEN